MSKKYAKTIIAGNWKMNKNQAETRNFFAEIIPQIGKAKNCKTVLCVPFIDIPIATRITRRLSISIGAQNMHFEPSGAYTGEISADMLKSSGVKYVIIGHSERREYFAETDETVNKKIKAALNADLTPIVCVGESLSQRESNIQKDFIAMQVKLALEGISANEAKKLVFAYEPIWAIGTGKTATSDQAEEICAFIRSILRSLYGARVARGISILYGGSMNTKNAAELLSKDNVNGGLIGGASLVPSDFIAIVKSVV